MENKVQLNKLVSEYEKLMEQKQQITAKEISQAITTTLRVFLGKDITEIAKDVKDEDILKFFWAYNFDIKNTFLFMEQIEALVSIAELLTTLLIAYKRTKMEAFLRLATKYNMLVYSLVNSMKSYKGFNIEMFKSEFQRKEELTLGMGEEKERVQIIRLPRL